MKALVGAFNQEKALVVIVQLHRLIDLRHYWDVTMDQLSVRTSWSIASCHKKLTLPPEAFLLLFYWGQWHHYHYLEKYFIADKTWTKMSKSNKQYGIWSAQKLVWKLVLLLHTSLSFPPPYWNCVPIKCILFTDMLPLYMLKCNSRWFQAWNDMVPCICTMQRMKETTNKFGKYWKQKRGWNRNIHIQYN